MSKRLTWRKEPYEQFMTRERGVDLSYGWKEIACVRPHKSGAWYYYTIGEHESLGIAGKNSLNAKGETASWASMEEAKVACKAYVVEQMKGPPKPPTLKSASVVARQISKLLRERGLPMAKTGKSRHITLSGFLVRRSGFRHVGVDYVSPGSFDEAFAKIKAEREAEVRELLVQCGYAFDHNNFLECEDR